jgi:hypothetical protein
LENDSEEFQQFKDQLKPKLEIWKQEVDRRTGQMGDILRGLGNEPDDPETYR